MSAFGLETEDEISNKKYQMKCYYYCACVEELGGTCHI